MYRALDRARKEIRLLLVQPGCGDEIVRGFFCYTFLAEAEQLAYETISYVWGDRTVCSDIEIDGALLTVPASSAAALKCMRHSASTRMLWIDAVCIDQGNDEEREHQVGLMGEVYSRGSCNLAYLGGEDRQRGELAANAVEDIREHESGSEQELIPNSWVGKKDDQLATLGIQLSRASLDAMRHALENLWFRRLWVLQEAALPKRTIIHIDGTKIELSHLLEAYTYLRLHGSGDIGICEAIWSVPYDGLLEMVVTCWWLRRNPDFPIPLSSLLQCSSGFEVTDERDKVYAMLGLFRRGRADQGIPSLLAPDYAKEYSAIMRDATLYAIHDSMSLSIWRQQRRIADIVKTDCPSWVPLLMASYPASEYPFPFLWNSKAHGKTREKVELALNLSGQASTILRIRGSLVDTIRAKTLSISGAGFVASGHQFLNCAVSVSMSRPCANQRAMQELELTLVGGERLGVHGEGPLPTLLATTNRNESSWDDVYADDVRKFCRHRCVFTTHRDYLGLGPELLRESDIIAIMSGGPWPFALRRCEGHEEQYRLLGPCYVYGIMNGELADSLDDKAWRWFDII